MKGLHPGKVPYAQVGCQFKRLGLTRVGMANMGIPAQCRAMKGLHPGKVPSAQKGKTESDKEGGEEYCLTRDASTPVTMMSPMNLSDLSLVIRSACSVCS